MSAAMRVVPQRFCAFVSYGRQGHFSFLEALKMTCPQCGQEMEPGRLFGKAPLLWSPKKKKLLLLRENGEVHIIQGKFPAAWICKSCRIVIVNY